MLIFLFFTDTICFIKAKGANDMANVTVRLIIHVDRTGGVNDTNGFGEQVIKRSGDMIYEFVYMGTTVKEKMEN